MACLLFVDDEPEIRELMRESLEAVGHRVVCAGNGVEALQATDDNVFDVVITDLRMPVMGGQELIRRLEDADYTGPVLVMSAYGDMDTVIDLMRHSTRDFLQKPTRPSELVAAIDRVLAGPTGTTAATHQTAASPPAAAPAIRVPNTRRQATGSPSTPTSESLATPTGTDPAPDDPMFALRSRLHDGSIQVPVMGPVFRGMLELAKQPVASSTEVLRLVGNEPAIAAGILRVANSAFYAGLEPVKSLKEAVVRLGNKTVLNIANTVLVRDFFTVSGRVYHQILLGMWANTVATAHAARLLADQTQMLDPDRAYMVALFHNIGEPLLIRVASEVHPADELDADELAALRGSVQGNHAQVGTIMLRAWACDAQLIGLTAHHRAPAIFLAEEHESREAQSLLTVITLADQLAANAGYVYLGARADRDEMIAAAQLARVDLKRLDVLIESIRSAVGAFH